MGKQKKKTYLDVPQGDHQAIIHHVTIKHENNGFSVKYFLSVDGAPLEKVHNAVSAPGLGKFIEETSKIGLQIDLSSLSSLSEQDFNPVIGKTINVKIVDSMYKGKIRKNVYFKKSVQSKQTTEAAA